MTNTLQTQESSLVPAAASRAALEMAIGRNDLSRLSPDDRLNYIGQICKLVGLNPLTQPIKIINIKGKDTLYADKSCAEQLRELHKISVKIVERVLTDGVYVVRAQFRDVAGREDEAIGAVGVATNATPDDKANAMMKAETKAKRRGTLSFVGLGFLPDESELHSTPQTSTVTASEESVTTRAEALNAALTAGEKSAAVTVEAEIVTPSTLPQEQAATAPQAASVTPRHPAPHVNIPKPPEPAAVKPAATAGEVAGVLDDETVRNLETVLSEFDAVKAVEFLVHKKKLQRGAGLETMSKEHAGWIIRNDRQFHKMVEGFTTPAI